MPYMTLTFPKPSFYYLHCHPLPLPLPLLLPLLFRLPRRPFPLHRFPLPSLYSLLAPEPSCTVPHRSTLLLESNSKQLCLGYVAP
ncbi:unnamed protein product [Closterium sp. NIES-53]